MAPDRPTPPPPSDVCRHHSGYSARLRDLEGRANEASKERKELVNGLNEIKVSIGRWMGLLGGALAVLQIAVAYALKSM